MMGQKTTEPKLYFSFSRDAAVLRDSHPPQRKAAGRGRWHSRCSQFPESSGLS